MKKSTGKKAGKRDKQARGGKSKQSSFSDYRKMLNPLITIQEQDGEMLYAIIDFSLPGTDHVRRIISKKVSNGNIFAVTYLGKVGPDKTCETKNQIMEMQDVTQQKFWESVRILSALYQIKGGVTEIRNYNGKTMKEAASLMRKMGNAQVWESGTGPL